MDRPACLYSGPRSTLLISKGGASDRRCDVEVPRRAARNLEQGRSERPEGGSGRTGPGSDMKVFRAEVPPGRRNLRKISEYFCERIRRRLCCGAASAMARMARKPRFSRQKPPFFLRAEPPNLPSRGPRIEPSHFFQESVDGFRFAAIMRGSPGGTVSPGRTSKTIQNGRRAGQQSRSACILDGLPLKNVPASPALGWGSLFNKSFR